MSINQLSVFVENQAGRIGRITQTLEAADVSIRGFSLADTADYGIARLVVDKPAAGEAALKAAGFLVRSGELLCVELPDKPGALDHVFTSFAEANINIEYAYSLVSTYVAIKVADIPAAEQQLANQAVRLVNQDELEELVVS
ncbi:MAG: hypothetical protein LBR39_05335 [Coriobacteriales bacterium]|nr:hypothetical protein [Coriobacteriales bacterium]